MPLSQTNTGVADRAQIVHSPNLTVREKIDALGLKNAGELRELAKVLPQENLPAVITQDDYDRRPSTIASYTPPWNPVRESQFRSFQSALYGNRVATIKDVCKYCWTYGGPKGGLSAIQSGLRLQASWAADGFTHITEKDNRVKTYYDAFAELWGLRGRFFSIFYNLFMYDNAIIVWRKPKSNVYGRDFLEFTVRDVKDVRVEYTGAITDVTDDGNLVYLEIDQAHRDKMLQLSRSNNYAERRQAMAFAEQNPRLWQEYNNPRSNGEYLLSNAEGEYWAIINLHHRGLGLDDPTMETIFPDIEVVSSLRDGDMVIASLIKRVIGLVTMGETLNQNEVPPGDWVSRKSTVNPGWPTEKDFAKIKAALGKRSSVLLYLFGNHTLKAAYVFPDPKILDSSKYVQSLENIMSWLCMGPQFLCGEGGKFQSAEINKIGLTARLDTMRELAIEEFVRLVYKHPTININNYDAVPKINFNRNVLKPPKEVREDIKLDVQLGMSQRTALEERGRDFDREMARTEADRKKYDGTMDNQVDFTGNTSNPGAGRPGETTVPQPNEVRRDEV